MFLLLVSFVAVFGVGIVVGSQPQVAFPVQLFQGTCIFAWLLLVEFFKYRVFGVHLPARPQQRKVLQRPSSRLDKENVNAESKTATD